MDFQLDPAQGPEYPVRILVEIDMFGDDGTPAQRRAVSSKASDRRRQCTFASAAEHWTAVTCDHIWGLLTLYHATFPDIGKLCAIHSKAGSVKIIPHERISLGQYPTRLCVSKSRTKTRRPMGILIKSDKKTRRSKRRAAITLDRIMEQAIFASSTVSYKLALMLMVENPR